MLLDSQPLVDSPVSAGRYDTGQTLEDRRPRSRHFIASDAAEVAPNLSPAGTMFRPSWLACERKLQAYVEISALPRHAFSQAGRPPRNQSALPDQATADQLLVQNSTPNLIFAIPLTLLIYIFSLCGAGMSL